MGSANESENFILLSKDLQYINDAQYALLSNEINQIKAMLIALIARVRA